MSHIEYTIGATIVLFFIIITTRALPFVFGRTMQKSPWVLFIGKQLPTSIILLLCIYYIISMAKPAHWHILPYQLIAIAITLCTQWKWRNTTISLLIGTGIYLLMTYYFC